MNIESWKGCVKHMTKLWDEERKNWNMRAADFREKKVSPHRQAQLDRFWEFVSRNNLVHPGEKGIDIGCGTGGYIRRLAREKIQMTGVDISDAMIEYAKMDTPYDVNWVISPWTKELVLEKKWDKAFEFAYSVFSPAMDGAGLTLLDQVAYRGHLIVTFTARKNEVYDRVEQRLGRAEDSRWRSTVTALYNTLKDLDRQYKVEVEKAVYEETTTVNEAVSFYTRRLHRHFNCSLEELEDAVRTEIQRATGLKKGEDIFSSTIENTMDWIYW